MEYVYGYLNSSGEFLLTSEMAEDEFKQKFIAYCTFLMRHGPSSTGVYQFPFADRNKYHYLDSSLSGFDADNTEFQAFRFSGTNVYCSVMPESSNPEEYALYAYFLYKDA